MNLSVIIPVYNVKPFLPDLIDSLAANDPNDVELVFVDDCSTDDTWDALLKLVDKISSFTIKLERHQKNRGLSASRNTGLNAAEGRFVLFLDSDDFLSKNAFKYIKEKIEDNNFDMCILRFSYFTTEHYYDARLSDRKIEQIVKEEGRRPGPYSEFQKIHAWNDEYNNVVRDVDKHSLMRDHIRYTIFYAWAYVFKRSIIADVEFVEGVYFEDVQFTLQMMLRSENVVAEFTEPIILYRQRSGSIMSYLNDKKLLDLLAAIDPVYDGDTWRNLRDDNLKNYVYAINTLYYIWAIANIQAPKKSQKIELVDRDNIIRILENHIVSFRKRTAGNKQQITDLLQLRLGRMDRILAYIVLNFPVRAITGASGFLLKLQRSRLWQVSRMALRGPVGD